MKQNYKYSSFEHFRRICTENVFLKYSMYLTEKNRYNFLNFAKIKYNNINKVGLATLNDR